MNPTATTPTYEELIAENKKVLDNQIEYEYKYMRERVDEIHETRRFLDFFKVGILPILITDIKPQLSMYSGNVRIGVAHRDTWHKIRTTMNSCIPAPDKKNWTREVGDDGASLKYSNTMFDSKIVVIIQVGELPPSCQIVEVEEIVPARQSYTHKVKKVQCKAPTTHEPGQHIDVETDGDFS